VIVTVSGRLFRGAMSRCFSNAASYPSSDSASAQDSPGRGTARGGGSAEAALASRRRPKKGDTRTRRL
jgi:hypothetical protein